jgi:hypothetical protein
MILFFNSEEQIAASHEEYGYVYEHTFDKFDDTTNTIYFTTPCDHDRRVKSLENKKSNTKLNVVNPYSIASLPVFPKNIGFIEFDEVVDILSKVEKIDIGILNAMSNAIGDHLIGMQAFAYFQNKLAETFPDKEIKISLYQFNPYHVQSITVQWQGKFQHVFMLPNRVSKLCQHNAFIDLGTLLLRENFDNQPMIDFFLGALSIDPSTVPVEAKRVKYQVNPQAKRQAQDLFVVLKSSKRPILLFHNTSTSPIRSINTIESIRIIKEILNKSDYFVVTTSHSDFQHPRFLSLSKYSQRLDDFAAIISQVDAIVTVDTSTYHIADAFNIPTVVLFTSIQPEYRIKYYPYTRAIMLEEKDGLLWGRHKIENTKSETLTQYVDQLCKKIDVDQVLQLIEEAKVAAF